MHRIHVHTNPQSLSVLPVLRLSADVQAKRLGVQVHLVPAVLQNGRDGACVFELPQTDIAPRLLDRISNELC